jgi:Zn ribbon nucleic-acid-binding protein
VNLERIFAEQVCPACGYQLDFTPWEERIQSERPCPCCGIHFGHDDLFELQRPAVYRAWRVQWIGLGKRWWSKDPPPDFDPDAQLLRLYELADEPPEWR